MRAPINSEKHYVNYNNVAVAASTLAVQQIATVTDNPASASSDDIRQGSVIKAVFIEMWYNSDDTALTSAVVSLEKVQRNTNMTYTQSLTPGTYVNKKNILFMSQGNVPPNIQAGLPLLRGWFKIPKGKQRFGLGDELVLNSSGIGNGLNMCGFMTYKEYF